MRKEPDIIDVAVGVAISRLRRERKLSQDRLAMAMGVSFQQIQKYESGTNRISASMLVKAAAALKVQPADLLPQVDSEPLPAFTRQLTTNGADALLEDYAAIKVARHRRVVLVVARALREGGQISEDEA